ncbi:lasso peptide biosynthesis B2 protein [Saccharothrix xinjiangensis]|uniref:Lasso peptide biosynthesis B2 protein n=1 Tax=Saccharothrix xinjiangensis TaxID=204798 RepID=A0ABV9XZQ9_9PSEU
MRAKATAVTRTGGVGLPRRLSATLSIYLARALSTRSPQRIRRVLAVLRRGARPATLDEARAAHRSVLASSVMVAGDGCLPRSIAVVLLCRVRGGWPTWRVGTRLHPFRAHAWVEVDGVPVGEPSDMGHWIPLITIDPPTSGGSGGTSSR